jgi:hypothetical protein
MQTLHDADRARRARIHGEGSAVAVVAPAEPSKVTPEDGVSEKTSSCSNQKNSFVTKLDIRAPLAPGMLPNDDGIYRRRWRVTRSCG